MKRPPLSLEERSRKDYDADYYRRNKERKDAYARAYQREHRKRLNAYQRQRYHAKKETS